MRFLSICSGIEAASVAWHPLGWRALALSEIEAFPRAVLAHHYPGVPLHGDFTTLRNEPFIVDAEALVGGTPCQAFSVAGLRNSLADDRGNLSLEFVRLADAIDDIRSAAGRDPAIIVWENVPGVLSVKDNAFGCFLAALAGDASPYVPPRGKWTNAGVVAGPARTVAWIVKDAQYFGVAQRRRRVFVVASARAGFDPAAVLFECEGVRRDTPPRREKGQAVAGTIEASLGRSRGAGTPPGALSHWDGDENPHPTLNQSAKSSGGVGSSNQELFSQRGAYLAPAVCPTLRAGGNKTGGDRPPGTDVDTADSLIAVYGGNDTRGALHPVVMAHGQANAEIRTDGGAPALTCLHEAPIVAHSLRGEGFDASEDGTGRGTPLVPVAFSSKDHGADATEDLSPTLRAMPHHGSHANGGGQMAVAVPLQEVGKRTGVSTDDPRAGIGIGQDGDPMFTLQAGAQHGVAFAFHENQRAEVSLNDTAGALNSGGGKPGQGYPAVAYAFQPRIARNGRGDMGDVVNALNAQSGETGKGDAAPCVPVINGDHINAYAKKTGPIKALRTLRAAIGEEAFTLWGFGILAAFQPAEILRSALHGCGLRYPAFSRSWVVGCALGCAEQGSGWLLQSLREIQCEGCPPPGWQPLEQLNRELGAYLSRLSQPGASAEGVVHDLWIAAEGPGILRQALSAVQEMGRPARSQGQPAYAAMAVRRLTATECEFLQGFPRGYTNIPWRGKPEAPDGPRYKALGNSMAVPVMAWIGRRIEAEINKSQSSERAA